MFQSQELFYEKEGARQAGQWKSTSTPDDQQIDC
jgi:hypothetical protein